MTCGYSTSMLYPENPPDKFKPSMEVSAVHCFRDNKILLLKRAPDKKVEPGKWGVPAGRIHENESKLEAALREMHEETGINLKAGDLRYLSEIPVRYPGFDFNFHIFRCDMDTFPVQPSIRLNREHTDYAWADLFGLESWDLMMDELACIRLFEKT